MAKPTPPATTSATASAPQPCPSIRSPPQSAIEHRLVETMALAWWCQTSLGKLETTLLIRETTRLQDATLDEDPLTLLAFAFQSLGGDGCALDLISRLESRCDRNYNLAFERLTALQARREKINTSVRTQQVTENTPPLPAMIASARS